MRSFATPPANDATVYVEVCFERGARFEVAPRRDGTLHHARVYRLVAVFVANRFGVVGGGGSVVAQGKTLQDEHAPHPAPEEAVSGGEAHDASASDDYFVVHRDWWLPISMYRRAENLGGGSLMNGFGHRGVGVNSVH